MFKQPRRWSFLRPSQHSGLGAVRSVVLVSCQCCKSFLESILLEQDARCLISQQRTSYLAGCGPQPLPFLIKLGWRAEAKEMLAVSRRLTQQLIRDQTQDVTRRNTLPIGTRTNYLDGYQVGRTEKTPPFCLSPNKSM